MSVIIVAELSEKKLKKQSLEAISYGVAVANQLNTEACALVIGESEEALASLGSYGLKKVVHQKQTGTLLSDNKLAAKFIAEICAQQQAEVVVFSNSLFGKAVAPRLSVKLKAGLVTGAVKVPDVSNGFKVRKSVFSGKAFADVNILTHIKIISLNANAFDIIQSSTGSAEVIDSSLEIGSSTINVMETKKNEGSISLADADRVVSGGRGLKGPENWGMIEELANALGAATACSRPVADSNWRPHHEHVGQTGVAISPNLYIAVGISGAIQHLAGVNRSKTIVVINNDPEAPFFKAADYGIVGDAFQVMPKIIEAVKNLG
ncbi:MAG: electron transfer flavoprotein subunit alpha/FixB family protein [Bacteroidota bacterium]